MAALRQRARKPALHHATPGAGPRYTSAMAPTSRKRQRRNLPTSPTPRPRPAAARRSASAQPADSSTRATRVLDWLLQKLPAAHRSMARDYLVLTRMDRPIGALLLLWPTWWALWLAAADFPPVKLLVIFTLGVFSMRAAGCAINDFADRKLDPQVARTAGRPIAAGRVTLTDGRDLSAALMVAAEGRISPTRQEAGIAVARWDYHHRAMIVGLAHEKPHDNVAWEIFYPAGPFALLPMLDGPGGTHRSALVWTVAEKDAA